jgi:hypothetical protein
VKIESQSEGETTIIWLIGRIRAEDLDQLKKQLENSAEAKILDLSELTIVDAEVIRFLSVIEREGSDSWAACPTYVREWILRERPEKSV